MRVSLRILIVFFTSMVTISCMGTAGQLRAGDVPVSADEPRTELQLRLELSRAQDCEEAFDLALYQQLGIELVIWDRAKHQCGKRVVTIRYLPRRMKREVVLSVVRQQARQAVVLEPERLPD